MGYLADHQAIRQDPRQLLAGAQSAIILGLPYFQGDKTPKRLDGTPRIAQYARLKDYHRLLWRRGEELLAAIIAEFCPTAVGRVVVDSAPLLERALAARTGAGFVGKNTCFISPRHGSFFLLAEILLTAALPLPELSLVVPSRADDRTAAGGCGSCKRCQVHCPTGALTQDYSLDANLCLAYWTIEHRGTIPERFWPWLRDYVFGCDICQLVCPYNRGKATRAEPELVRVAKYPDLLRLATMSQADYERDFGGTPVTRAKRQGLMRNALIALTVTADPRLPEALALAPEASGQDATVLATIAQIQAYRPMP